MKRLLHMKKLMVMAWMIVTILLLAGSAVWANGAGGTPTIFINDLGEDNPAVTADGFSPPQYLAPPVIQTASEYAHATGTIYLSAGFELQPGNFGFNFVEFQGGPVSDFLTLSVSAQDPTNFSQTFEATFWSDGADGFSAALAQFNIDFPGAISVVEDGITPFGITYGGSLSVLALSDYDVAQVPEPTTMLLYGLGFAGAGLYRRMRRRK